MVENWRAVVEPGFEAHYEVSSEGRVRRIQTGRVLRLGVHSKGYRSVVLSVAGVRRSVLVHRLVLMAFVGPPQPGQETRHVDGDRANNALSNLAWGTNAENYADRVGHGTALHGDRNPRAKITSEQAQEIIARCQTGESQRSVAQAYGLSQPQVSRIITGKRRGPHPEG